jgi:outer membrane protein, heavy metal efflux system
MSPFRCATMASLLFGYTVNTADAQHLQLDQPFLAAGPILERPVPDSMPTAHMLAPAAHLKFLAAGPVSIASDALSDAAEDGNIPGESLPELLAMARKLNSEIAAAVLDARGAEAAAAAAGALEDPQFTISLEDTGRTSTGLPKRVGTAFYELDQRLPWWGKRGLQRAVARAEVDRSKASSQVVTLELETRVKQAFVDAWLAAEAIAINEENLRDLRSIADLTTERYRLGLARQSEVSEAEIGASEALAEELRLNAVLAGAKARLNGLLDREPDAPLKNPTSLPAVPAEDRLSLDYLLERAMAGSPVLAERRAALAGARDNRRLTEKQWYPDFTVGFSVVDGFSRDGEEDGYEARFGINLPLQWGVRRARISEASAQLGAADDRVRSAERELQANLAASLSALDAAQRRAELLAHSHLAQATAALGSIEAAYPLGRATLGELLDAHRRLRDIHLEHLKEEAEQRRLLAEIEMMIGGDL